MKVREKKELARMPTRCGIAYRSPRVIFSITRDASHDRQLLHRNCRLAVTAGPYRCLALTSCFPPSFSSSRKPFSFVARLTRDHTRAYGNTARLNGRLNTRVYLLLFLFQSVVKRTQSPRDMSRFNKGKSGLARSYEYFQVFVFYLSKMKSYMEISLHTQDNTINL